MSSKAFGPKQPLIPHHAPATQEIGDLRADVEEAMVSLESKSGYPQLDKMTGGGAVSLAAVPVAAALAGSGFLQDQVKATLTLGTGTASLAFTANRPGVDGNAIQIKIVQGAGALAVGVVGSVVTITLAAAGSTANAVKAAFDAVAAAAALAQVVSGGAGTVLVAAQTPLAGGVGLGLEVLANGLPQTVAGAVTDTAIPLVVSDLTGAANGDSVSVLVRSNGRISNSLAALVVT